MAFAQKSKDCVITNSDKENSSTQANITTKKANFLIKKCPKATIKPLIKSLIQPTLDYLDAQVFHTNKLSVINQNVQDPALTKKQNANKVKKALVFEKENQNLKKEQVDSAPVKDKQNVPSKGKLSNQNKLEAKEIEDTEVEMPSTHPGDLEKLEEPDEILIKDVSQDGEENHDEVQQPSIQELEDITIETKTEEKEDKSIFQRVKACQMVKAYASDIIRTLKEKDEHSRPVYCLKKHKISPTLRTKMIDWMIEVMCSYKCSDQAFFMAVGIMDDFFQKSEVVQTGNDLHLIGVTSMFIASKFEEIYPMRLSLVYEKIAHKKLTTEEITMKEGEILNTLKFNLVFAPTYDFVTNVLFQLSLEDVLSAELYVYLQKVCLYLTKALLHDYELINQYNNCQLAASTLFVAFKVIEQLDSNFPLMDLITKVCEILGVDDETLYTCASKILALAKNFEKTYPNYKNLKKFHFLGAPGENAPSEDSQGSGNKLNDIH